MPVERPIAQSLACESLALIVLHSFWGGLCQMITSWCMEVGELRWLRLMDGSYSTTLMINHGFFIAAERIREPLKELSGA